MNPEAMTPYGRALLAYFEGRTEAEIIIRRDDGVEASLPVSHYFRAQAEFTSIEAAALQRCGGRVLDVGAGSGLTRPHPTQRHPLSESRTFPTSSRMTRADSGTMCGEPTGELRGLE